MEFATLPNVSWKIEPYARPFQQMIFENRYIDRFVAYIVGEGTDGKRYVRTVGATGRQMDSGAAEQKLKHVLALVHRDGPSVCTQVQDNGSYPREAYQPKID